VLGKRLPSRLRALHDHGEDRQGLRGFHPVISRDLDELTAFRQILHIRMTWVFRPTEVSKQISSAGSGADTMLMTWRNRSSAPRRIPGLLRCRETARYGLCRHFLCERGVHPNCRNRY